jgi:Tfp pilus assembly protein PilN
MLSLAYPKLTAVLVKGLQEQQAEIGRQQATIDSLKQKVRSLQTVKKRQARLAEQMAALQERTVDTRTGALPAGWGLSTLLALLLAGAGFGAGLFWRRTGA